MFSSNIYLFSLFQFLGVSDLKLSYKENWELCIDETVKYLGHAVGALYVNHYFPKDEQDEVISYFIDYLFCFNNFSLLSV